MDIQIADAERKRGRYWMKLKEWQNIEKNGRNGLTKTYEINPNPMLKRANDRRAIAIAIAIFLVGNQRA